jgi:hypothetical protein
LLKMLDAAAADFDPSMFRPLENRSYGSRVCGIGYRSDSDPNHLRQIAGLPKDRRAAVSAKIARDLAATRGGAGEFLRPSRDRDGLGGIECAHIEWRAGSPLAIDAMASDNEPGWPREGQRNGTTTALGIDHRMLPSRAREATHL